MTTNFIPKTEQQEIFDTVKSQIDEAKQKKWNLLLPSMSVSPLPESLFVPSLERVEMDVSQDSKDYYKATGSSKFRLHATALNRIALAGELKWNNQDTGYFKDDDGSLIFRACGGVVNSAGNVHFESGYYSLNLEDIHDDLVEKYTDKSRNLTKDKDNGRGKRPATDNEKQAYIDYCVSRDYRQKRQFRLQLCETSAKNRVIRKIFNVKNEYSMEELKNPFLVLKFSIYMDYKDPIVKQMVLGMKIQAALGVYGINPQSALPEPSNLAIPAPSHMEPFNPDDDPNLQEPDDFPEPMEEYPEEELIDSSETDFLNSDDDTQKMTLVDLSKRTGIPLDDVRLKVENKGNWLKLFQFFQSKLSDKPNDDIPV